MRHVVMVGTRGHEDQTHCPSRSLDSRKSNTRATERNAEG